MAEIDVQKEGVKGAKNFFEAKVSCTVVFEKSSDNHVGTRAKTA